MSVIDKRTYLLQNTLLRACEDSTVGATLLLEGMWGSKQGLVVCFFKKQVKLRTH